MTPGKTKSRHRMIFKRRDILRPVLSSTAMGGRKIARMINTNRFISPGIHALLKNG